MIDLRRSGERREKVDVLANGDRGFLLGGHVLEGGDGAAVSDEPRLEISARADSEVLLFDLA